MCLQRKIQPQHIMALKTKKKFCKPNKRGEKYLSSNLERFPVCMWVSFSGSYASIFADQEKRKPLPFGSNTTIKSKIIQFLRIRHSNWNQNSKLKNLKKIRNKIKKLEKFEMLIIRSLKKSGKTGRIRKNQKKLESR